VERNDGFISVRHAKIHNTPEMAAADYRFVERYMKFLLWSIGGFRVYVCGCGSITKKLQQAYLADEQAKILAAIPNDSKILVLGRTGSGWSVVSYGNQTGYAKSEYII
jgi:hypothetical protein